MVINEWQLMEKSASVCTAHVRVVLLGFIGSALCHKWELQRVESLGGAHTQNKPDILRLAGGCCFVHFYGV
jgi:hypothetical protein